MAKTSTTTEKKPKRLQGVVVSDKMEKSIVVRVEQKFAHKFYGKIIKKHKRYNVHCEDDKVAVGDTVVIEEGKPLSARKSFYFVSKVDKSA